MLTLRMRQTLFVGQVCVIVSRVYLRQRSRANSLQGSVQYVLGPKCTWHQRPWNDLSSLQLLMCTLLVSHIPPVMFTNQSHSHTISRPLTSLIPIPLADH